MSAEVPEITEDSFILWYAEELAVTVKRVGLDMYVRVSGDYEVGKARFYLTPDDMEALGQWFIEKAREHVS